MSVKMLQFYNFIIECIIFIHIIMNDNNHITFLFFYMFCLQYVYYSCCFYIYIFFFILKLYISQFKLDFPIFLFSFRQMFLNCWAAGQVCEFLTPCRHQINSSTPNPPFSYPQFSPALRTSLCEAFWRGLKINRSRFW